MIEARIRLGDIDDCAPDSSFSGENVFVKSISCPPLSRFVFGNVEKCYG